MTSSTPSDMPAQAPAGAPNIRAPASVPQATPNCMPPTRRSIGARVPKGRVCQTLVTSDGITSKDAACAGSMKIDTNAIEIAGKHSPTTPLISPATTNNYTSNPNKTRDRQENMSNNDVANPKHQHS